MDAIQSSTLKQVRISTPPLPEQQRILQIYQESKAHLDEMYDVSAKLRLQKSGLMQDLLSGKVSVAPLLENAV